MLKTIKNKLVALSAVVIFISMSIPILFLISQFEKNFQERSQAMVNTTLDILKNGIDNVMMLGDEKNIDEIVKQFSSSENIKHIRIINPNGKILYATENSEIGKQIEIVAPHHITTELKKLKERGISLLNEKNTYVAAEPILNSSECQTCHSDGPVIAYMDIDTNLTSAEVKFYTGTLHIVFLAIVVFIVLIVGLYHIFEHYINKPLKRFNLAMEQVQENNFDVVLPAQRNDEISLLENHFNNMVSELKDSRNKIEELHFEGLQRVDKLTTLGELASEFAHEINNHTAVILSRSDFLRMETDENTQLYHYREDLDVILKQINKITKITTGILRNVKKQKTQFQKINLVATVNESLQIFEPLLEKKGIKLIKEFSLSHAPIYGDALLIDQMLTNLVVNSIDAIKSRGELKICVNETEDGNYEFSISDSGSGMDEYMMTKIFTPFFTTKEVGKGTGLGLYIIKNICTLHNAEITCESKIGEGTIFKITFNRLEEKHEENFDC